MISGTDIAKQAGLEDAEASFKKYGHIKGFDFKNPYTSKEMSEAYVKGWYRFFDEIDEVQHQDERRAVYDQMWRECPDPVSERYRIIRAQEELQELTADIREH